MLEWKSIAVPSSEISLARVLRCGQTFRWKNINNVWSFAMNDRIVFVKQDDEQIYFSHILKKDQVKGEHDYESTRAFLEEYFNLDIKLVELYDFWLARHLSHAKSTKNSSNTPFHLFPGIRSLRQHPWETSISFICSSNNNVKRISKMCDNLCIEFGDYINEYQGIKYYSFPSAEQLSTSANVETTLRELGFGYRAKYIYQTALKFTSDEFPDITIDKLVSLRNESYPVAHEFLLQLNGVGPKVADCICLMSLDKHDTIPVDTHIYQIAMRDYKFKGKKDMKSMNKQMYADIREFFQEMFGPYAGWAQSVLFASDLSDLNNGTNIQSDMMVVESEIKSEIKKEIKREIEDINSEIKMEIEVKQEITRAIKQEFDSGIKIKKELKSVKSIIKKEPISEAEQVHQPKRIRVR